jgi:hypothetical protein
LGVLAYGDFGAVITVDRVKEPSNGAPGVLTAFVFSGSSFKEPRYFQSTPFVRLAGRTPVLTPLVVTPCSDVENLLG